MEQTENQELTEERVRKIVREEIWAILQQISRQELEILERDMEFLREMGFPPPLR